MLSTILLILAFGLIVTIHELGHFLMARAFGVGVEKFSIGFGAPIIEMQRGGTKFLISWIPLGGYVKMKGENPDDLDESEESFQNKAWWQRALIGLAGPLANLILGFVLFFIALMLPQKLEDVPAVIHSAEGIWAQHFSYGDSLISLNDTPVKGFNDFLMLSMKQPSVNSIRYQRGDSTLELKVNRAQRDSLLRSIKPIVGNVIGEVFTGMPAWKAGLKPLDKVIAVDSVLVSDWYDMRQKIINSPGGVVNLTLERDGAIFQRTMLLETNIAASDTKMIGISQYMPISQKISYTPLQAVQYGAISTMGFVGMNYSALFKLAGRPKEVKNNLGSVVMLSSMTNDISRKGIGSLILFFGSISLLLMIMNLLPIPILDGGMIIFCLIEGIIRRPIPVKVQIIAQKIGFALLITLAVYAFYADFSKLFLRYIHTR